MDEELDDEVMEVAEEVEQECRAINRYLDVTGDVIGATEADDEIRQLEEQVCITFLFAPFFFRLKVCDCDDIIDANCMQLSTHTSMLLICLFSRNFPYTKK
jgi:hypothetical protein